MQPMIYVAPTPTLLIEAVYGTCDYIHMSFSYRVSVVSGICV